MSFNYLKIFLILLVILLSPKMIFAKCSSNVINGSASPFLAYDSQNNSIQHTHFNLTIQNTNNEKCVLSLIPFAPHLAVKLSNGMHELNYGISNNGTTSDILTQLPTNRVHVKSLNFTGSQSQQLKWDFFVLGSQKVSAGNYSDTSIQVQAYEHLDGNPNNFSINNLYLRDSTQIKPQALIKKQCSILGTPIVTTAINISYSGGANGNIDLSSAINAPSSSLKNATLGLTYPNSRCNYAANLSLKSHNGGLIIEGGAAIDIKGFLNRIDYHATASFCGKSISIITNGATISNTTVCNPGLNTTDLILILTVSTHDKPLLAGKYHDVLTVKIGAPI
ncbi:MAG: hypothetical protein KAG10_07795 [Methylococcales bacterium]|nr:hypothetical protein [Methylococcales bacterium]MCK5925779.1 hypothetical protein [Methylococcales bacterium]